MHSAPTPRLGGVAMATVILGVMATYAHHQDAGARAMLAGCAAVSLLGLFDDLRPIHPAIRLALQSIAAIALAHTVASHNFTLTFAPGIDVAAASPWVTVALVVWLTGSLNIFNFMDGLDGLAGMQALTAGVAYAWILRRDTGLCIASVAIAAAALGFLAHNLVPGRLFMGDAGSTLLGFAFAALAMLGSCASVALAPSEQSPCETPFFAASALSLAPFLLDATYTIVRRARRGERVWQAHRSHLYQRAAAAIALRATAARNGQSPTKDVRASHRIVFYVYSTWMVASAFAACFTAERGIVAMGVGWASALVALQFMHMWVRRLESRKAPSAP